MRVRGAAGEGRLDTVGDRDRGIARVPGRRALPVRRLRARTEAEDRPPRRIGEQVRLAGRLVRV